MTIYSVALEQKQIVIQAVKAVAASYGIVTDDQLKRIDEIFARAKDIDEGIREFKRFQEEQSSETMTNGSSPYVVVEGESELLRRLEQGWKLLQSLNSDKYLLQHP